MFRLFKNNTNFTNCSIVLIAYGMASDIQRSKRNPVNGATRAYKKMLIEEQNGNDNIIKTKFLSNRYKIK